MSQIITDLEHIEFKEILGGALDDNVAYLKCHMVDTRTGKDVFGWVAEENVPDGVPVSKAVAMGLEKIGVEL